MLMRLMKYTPLNKRAFGVRKCIWAKQGGTRRDTAKRAWASRGVGEWVRGGLQGSSGHGIGIVVFTVRVPYRILVLAMIPVHFSSLFPIFGCFQFLLET